MSGKKTGFTEDQVADFQETFMLFDTKGDGQIPVRSKGFARLLDVEITSILLLTDQQGRRGPQGSRHQPHRG